MVGRGCLGVVVGLAFGRVAGSLSLVVGLQSFAVLGGVCFGGVDWFLWVLRFAGVGVGASRLVYGLGVVCLVLVWLVGSC